jgi:hypothetical protein
MSDPPLSGRLRFTIGTAFPADDPVAVFLTVLCAGLNDLVLTNRLMTAKWGGDHPHALKDHDQQYLLRLCMAQLHEIRETVKHGERMTEVADFIESLPEDALRAHDTLLDPNRPGHQWINKAIGHVRNQTLHYGGRYNWDDATWGLTITASSEGRVEFADSSLGGMRAVFADLVTNQHLLRKLPEYDRDPQADLPDAVIEDRLAVLFQAVAESVCAATDFATLALNAYLDALPEGAIEAERDNS